MTEKIIQTLYNILSVTIWLTVIATLSFAGYLFASGASKAPVVSVEEITVSECSADDITANEQNLSTEGLFRAEFRILAKGERLSLYRYSAESVSFSDCALKKQTEFIKTDTEEISFSALDEEEFTLTAYFYADSSAAAEKTASEAVFSLNGLTNGFAFFNRELPFELGVFSAAGEKS